MGRELPQQLMETQRSRGQCEHAITNTKDAEAQRDGFGHGPRDDFTGERPDRRRLDVKDVPCRWPVPHGQRHEGGLTKSDRDYSIFYDVHIFYYLWYGSPSMDNK
ncbi:glycoprotein endo-alpha-1,2-mannosidase-like protein [Lates japonicus]|uniref:Glycoprotein endo-alpha-1,2-mannosidase-like protein n=1 Tax=Lates japonicus TaxID=270547 RepID=A0AAD3R2W9_LATJO|nr:glycoprotein endo-alpha-1,2-mannosidase-like protein [Lates japonicus]